MYSIFRQIGNYLFDIVTGIFIKLRGIQPIPTGQITENIFAVKTGSVNFYLYQKGDTIVAIDSGFGKNIIKREFSKLNLRPDKITAVFLTHSDFDHAGGLSIFTDADIYISADEEPMILHKIPRKYGFFYNRRIAKPYKLLRHSGEIQIDGIKICAIETPGHTPGSMSYLIEDKYLFVGDVFNLVNGKVYPTGKWFTMDKDKQIKSIKKLAAFYGIRMAFTAHRGYTEFLDKAIAEYK